MYGKIFAQMYEGTLGSRGPWEALVTFQQLIVLANRHGEVDMTADAISRRTTIPLDIIEKGLVALSQPDPDSRTPDEDGKRIVLLDARRAWGWRLVNYDKYRKIRNEEERREYQRKWVADKRKAGRPIVVDAMSTPVDNVDPCSKQYAVSSNNPLRIEAARVSGNTLPIAEGFEKFWSAYPRKKGKLEAQKAWRKVKPAEVEAIIARVELNKVGEWKDKDPQYIPNPSTWLNGCRWEDAIDPTPQSHQGPSWEELRLKRTQITPDGQAILEKSGGLVQ